MDLFKTLKNAWRVPELRKRIIYTLWMFLFIRIGVSITVPGVDRATVLASIASGDGTGFVNQFYGMITGGAHQQLALFALGVGPYITASIIMQLLQIAITRLEELAKEGEDGRKKINKYTRYVTLVLAILNGWATTFNASRNGYLVDSSIWTFLLVMFSFVAGCCIPICIMIYFTMQGVTGELNRMTAFEQDQNELSVMLSIAASFVFILLKQNYPKIVNILLVVFLYVCLIAILLTGSRTGLIIFLENKSAAIIIINIATPIIIGKL